MSAATASAAPPKLRHQADAQGDVTVIGSTLGFDCGSTVPAPAGAIASCAGQVNIADTAPDLYWRDNVANASITATQARTSATLSMPTGAKVTYARLYWAAMNKASTPGGPKEADTTAVLDWPDGPAVTIKADESWVIPYGLAVHPDRFYYQASGDATEFVAKSGAGDYRVSDVEALELAGIEVDRAFSAWTLVVFYEKSGDQLRNLALFDGFNAIDPGQGTPSAQVTLQGFLVPQGYTAKMSAFAYEGDSLYEGDHFTINGVRVSNAMNPENDFFNSSRSFLGAPVSGAADIPKLSGVPGSMAGYDLDTVDITSRISAGDKQAVVGADSSYDVFFLGGFVTSITNKAPEFYLTKTALDVNGGALLADDIIEYTITATNIGNDTSVNTKLEDFIQTGATYVPGSLEITQGSGAGTKTDAGGDDQGEFLGGAKKVVFRLGTGATGSKGGSVAPGETITLKFRVKVTAQDGRVENQATLTGAGASGGPEKTWLTDGDPKTIGAQPTTSVINECQQDAQCKDPYKPHCNTTAHVCEPCGTDNDCSNPSSPACQPNGSCSECSATNDLRCTPSKPVCDTNIGSCTLCTPGPTGDATKCQNSSDGPKCVTSPGNSNFCGCTTDADCGGTTSGKVCDTANTLKCIDGCRGQNGNGCPTGLTCTSQDSSIGKCLDNGGPENTNETCSDGIDNDKNGKTDCDDPSCYNNANVTVCAENTNEKCSDGIDNDHDSKTDCDDTDCQVDSVTVCGVAENTNEKCSDGIDNDKDGLTDCADPDCRTEGVTVCFENTDATCSDGIDNDKDGLTDCDDPDCASTKVCSGENTDATCSDGIDNDGNGKIDCDDESCHEPQVTICSGQGGLIGNESGDSEQAGGCGCAVPGNDRSSLPLGAGLFVMGLAALSTRRRRQH